MPGGTLAPTAEAPSRLLTASEPNEPHTVPAEAYRAVIFRYGQEVFATGGANVLVYLRRRLAEEAPDRAKVPEAILDTAWADLMEAHR